MTRMTLMDGGCSSANEVMGLVKLGNSKALAAMLQSPTPPLEELNTPDKNGRTCLSFAVSNGDALMVDLLLATEIPDPNIADKDGNTPLVYAVSLGNSAITEKLLKYDTTNIDQANHNGFTALIKAAIHDHHSCLELLIKAGADLDVRDHARNVSALQWAELCASKSCMKTLKKHKPHSAKKTNIQKKNSCREGNEHTSPLRKIKDSLSGLNHKHKEHRGIESVVACVSAPTIPMLLANANPPPNVQLLLEPSFLQQDSVKPSTPTKNPVIVAPRIEITSETGECIIPTKHFFTTPPCKHSK